MAAVICYEEIFIRDHWAQLSTCPWWYLHEPDLEKQMTWRRDVIDKTGQDWLVLPSFYTEDQRKRLTIETRTNRVFLVDRADGEEMELIMPKIRWRDHPWRGKGPKHPNTSRHRPLFRNRPHPTQFKDAAE